MPSNRLQAWFVSLGAVLDGVSCAVLSWALSITRDGAFCLEALEQALGVATPDILNRDPGAQFIRLNVTDRFMRAETRISLDGRGRALDNVVVERWWRPVKYEEVSPKDDGTPREMIPVFARFFQVYNGERPQQALGYRTPATVYVGSNG